MSAPERIWRNMGQTQRSTMNDGLASWAKPEWAEPGAVEYLRADLVAQTENAVDQYRRIITEMHGHVFFVQDSDGVLRRWHPPKPLPLTTPAEST